MFKIGASLARPFAKFHLPFAGLHRLQAPPPVLSVSPLSAHPYAGRATPQTGSVMSVTMMAVMVAMPMMMVVSVMVVRMMIMPMMIMIV